MIDHGEAGKLFSRHMLENVLSVGAGQSVPQGSLPKLVVKVLSLSGIAALYSCGAVKITRGEKLSLIHI